MPAAKEGYGAGRFWRQAPIGMLDVLTVTMRWVSCAECGAKEELQNVTKPEAMRTFNERGWRTMGDRVLCRQCAERARLEGVEGSPLDAMQRDVLERRIRGESVEEIADSFRVSRDRVRQVEKKAIRLLWGRQDKPHPEDEPLMAYARAYREKRGYPWELPSRVGEPDRREITT